MKLRRPQTTNIVGKELRDASIPLRFGVPRKWGVFLEVTLEKSKPGTAGAHG